MQIEKYKLEKITLNLNRKQNAKTKIGEKFWQNKN
jgi:hypothetical protein